MRKRVLTLVAGLLTGVAMSAQNPYLPLWEYIPDGEPYVFEDPDKPGEYRVYVYGSHDDLVTTYCGKDQVVWSASVDDLTNWRYDGVIFESKYDRDGNALHEDGSGDILYAPDVMEVKGDDGQKRYYLYPNNQAWGRETMVAMSNRPDGPYTVINWSDEDRTKTKGSLYFDPGVFMDDDGRAYAYWGFQVSECAELSQDFANVKQDTYIKNMIPAHTQDTLFRFFEASSIRKIADKYVFVYSRFTAPGEFGLPTSNYTLAYAYSDSPMGPFTYGGTLVDGRARGKDAHGNTITTACPFGNTHGSLCQINGKWWLFYHRQTGLDEFSRQAMVAPVEVKVERGKGGRVIISEAEYNSEGFLTEGLNPLHKTPAGWACYLTGKEPARQSFPNFYFNSSYIRPTRLGEMDQEGVNNHKKPYCPVVNNTDGSVVGYKYFRWDEVGKGGQVQLTVDVVPESAGEIRVVLGKEPYDGTEIARIEIADGMPKELRHITVDCRMPKRLKGKQALYFLFSSKTDGQSVCELHAFQFKY